MRPCQLLGQHGHPMQHVSLLSQEGLRAWLRPSAYLRLMGPHAARTGSSISRTLAVGVPCGRAINTTGGENPSSLSHWYTAPLVWFPTQPEARPATSARAPGLPAAPERG